MGAPFGLTNDGLDSGVGLYVDGVYYARPASATLDFLDVDQVEVLRGPQGTLFGKNASAGAINVTTRKPSFTPGTEFELNYGNIGFVQAKASITGPLSKKIAFRASFSGTQRNGVLLNTRTQDDVNDLNNLGFRGQVLFAPSDKLAIAVTGDDTRQRPKGFTQVLAGVAPTLRPANRQWPQIAADLDYTAPSYNAFDRVTDVDTPMRSYQDLGGASAECGLEGGPRPADVDDGVALLGLEAVERPRLHRPADHDDFVRHVETAPVDAGSALRRDDQSPAEFRRRRLLLRSDHRLESGDQAGTGIGGGARAAGADRRMRRRRVCSTATASTRSSIWTTSAPPGSARSNGRSPIACGCCRGFA